MAEVNSFEMKAILILKGGKENKKIFSFHGIIELYVEGGKRWS